MAKKKILLIDFDQEFLKFLSSALADEGFEVVTAADGLSGFERFSEYHPDLVIMEAMLPKFHGFELCSRITSHPTKKAPVIIVTGIYKDSVYKTEALRSLGASAYFEKPLNLEELLNKIYELVGRPEVKKAPVAAEKDVDQLLKEALSIGTEEKKPAPGVRPADRPRPAEKPVPGPAQFKEKEPVQSKDDEVDLLLKSKLKGLMIENSKAEPKPVSRPAVKPEKEKSLAGPAETMKVPASSTDPLLEELTRKLEPTPAPPRSPKAETPRVETRAVPVAKPRLEPRPEAHKDTIKESRPVSRPAQDEDRPRPETPAFTPFNGFIEEEKKEKSGGSIGKYIGLVAAFLAVAGVAAFLTLKKKETPSFSGHTSNQVAALQSSGTEPSKKEVNEEEIQEAIEKQIEAYRAQQIQDEPKDTPRAKPSGRTRAASGELSQATPYIPKQRTSLASLSSTLPSETQAASPPVSAESSTQTSSNQSADEIEEKAEEQNQSILEPQVVIPTQEVKPGDLLPLSMVDVEPQVVKMVEPIYPEADRRLGHRGQVLLNVLISENGDVLEARVIRGIKGSLALEKEAIKAVKKWKFLPAEKNGVKVKVWKPLTIGFGLNR